MTPIYRPEDELDRTRALGAEPPSFTCPVCRMTSYHPDDVRFGYCGNCHDWTGDQPARGAR